MRALDQLAALIICAQDKPLCLLFEVEAALTEFSSVQHILFDIIQCFFTNITWVPETPDDQRMTVAWGHLFFFFGHFTSLYITFIWVQLQCLTMGTITILYNVHR